MTNLHSSPSQVCEPCVGRRNDYFSHLAQLSWNRYTATEVNPSGINQHYYRTEYCSGQAAQIVSDISSFIVASHVKSVIKVSPYTRIHQQRPDGLLKEGVATYLHTQWTTGRCDKVDYLFISRGPMVCQRKLFGRVHLHMTL